MSKNLYIVSILSLLAIGLFPSVTHAQQDSLKACIDGTGYGWTPLTKSDFVDVNGDSSTWQWHGDTLYSTGEPIGVNRSRKSYTNFELVVTWRHLKSGGNSGVFLWVPLITLRDLEPGNLPEYGIEIQMLDHGFTEQYQERTGREGDWFTTNGDVFAVGNSKLRPFPPLSPNGSRSFPSKNLSNGAGQWNHYYVRAINGEVRLWVNGQEVSGGNYAQPDFGYLCFEAEGSPIEFTNIRIRELPD